MKVSYLFDDSADWADNWLGCMVSFSLNGHAMTGQVTGTERVRINGIHDILEIELSGEKKQVKIQMHRQAVKKIGD